MEQGLAASVEEARALIMAGKVLAGSDRIDKAGDLVSETTELRLRGSEPFVSRGGRKLEHALEELAIDVAGRVCLDAGASTGGFTDCLLRRGASRVYAVDVGYGQLAWKLRNDQRVAVMERTNLRSMDATALDPLPDLVTADLAFIALRKVLPDLIRLTRPGARFVLLVKPQFELPREDMKDVEGGVVTDPALHEQAVAAVEQAALAAGLELSGRVPSPIRGADGNREFFLSLARR